MEPKRVEKRAKLFVGDSGYLKLWESAVGILVWKLYGTKSRATESRTSSSQTFSFFIGNFALLIFYVEDT